MSNQEEEEEEEKCQCSFAFTGSHTAQQAIYLCVTCDPTSSKCCCAGCAEHCHDGHDISLLGYGNAYCDCGEANCSLVSQSMEKATELKRFSKVIGDDAITSNSAQLVYTPTFSEFTFEPVGVKSTATGVFEGDLSTHLRCLVSHSRDTFWVEANATPRCDLERLAQSIGQFHLQTVLDQVEDPTQRAALAAHSGFEWWVQLRNSDPASLRSTGVDLHYDKDEELAAAFGIGAFPAISTVTYVQQSKNLCHPTIIAKNCLDTPVGAPISDILISLPKSRKHIAFDGRLLHGAPAQLLDFSRLNSTQIDVSPVADERITFLVNIWVGHQPCAVTSLSEEILTHLQSLPSIFESSTPNGLQFQTNHGIGIENMPSIRIRDAESQDETVGDWLSIPFVSARSEWGKNEDEAGLELSIWLPHLSVSEFAASQTNVKRAKKSPSATQSSETSFTDTTTFLFKYTGRHTALLQYEVDEEADDEFAAEFGDDIGF